MKIEHRMEHAYNLRGIPHDEYLDLQRMAVEEGSTVGNLMREAISEKVGRWRTAEQKRLARRLDDLRQAKLDE